MVLLTPDKVARLLGYYSRHSCTAGYCQIQRNAIHLVPPLPSKYGIHSANSHVTESVTIHPFSSHPSNLSLPIVVDSRLPTVASLASFQTLLPLALFNLAVYVVGLGPVPEAADRV